MLLTWVSSISLPIVCRFFFLNIKCFIDLMLFVLEFFVVCFFDLIFSLFLSLRPDMFPSSSSNLQSRFVIISNAVLKIM